MTICLAIAITRQKWSLRLSAGVARTTSHCRCWWWGDCIITFSARRHAPLPVGVVPISVDAGIDPGRLVAMFV